MYALGVVHLEGHDKFHSCILAQQLFQNVINRGENSKIANNAYYYYLDGRYSTAAILYLEASFLGFEFGYTNSAVLIEKYKLLEKEMSWDELEKSEPEIKTYIGLVQKYTETDRY